MKKLKKLLLMIQDQVKHFLVIESPSGEADHRAKRAMDYLWSLDEETQIKLLMHATYEPKDLASIVEEYRAGFRYF